jgi:hypothetical protein
LVVVADGHSPNNMVAFWRDAVPSNWTAIAGQDIRVAGITNLTGFQNLNNGFQSVENSICVNGYDMAVAQFNGFNYACTNAKGVVKCRWDTTTNTLTKVWNNRNVNFNNALTYSRQSNLVYGNGKESDCNYYFYGLDWNTGAVSLRKSLGTSDDYNDQGCNISISDDSTLVEPTSTGFFQVKYTKSSRPTSVDNVNTDDMEFSIFPNPSPTSSPLFFKANTPINSPCFLSIYNATGQLVHTQKITSDFTRIEYPDFMSGFYYAELKYSESSNLKYSKIKGKKFVIQ